MFIDVPVTIAEAALGAKIQVPTLGGRAQITLPPGTDSGTKLRLRGKGVSSPKGEKGDLFVVIKVVVPRKLSEAERNALSVLERAYAGKNPRDHLG